MKRSMNSMLLTALFAVSLPLTSLAGTQVDVAAMWLAGDDPVPPTAEAASGAGAAEDAEYIDREIRVQVWHDKDDEAVYQRGEPMKVHFRANTDLYVVVYRIDTDGYVNVLWPTSRFDDGFVYGGHTYSLPAGDQRLYAGLSKGVEYLQAIGSKYPFDLRELGIDFAFDHAATQRYDYAVAGDPFLAVNDINYAITGLEEDVDYVVTDWSHLYVEQKVEYARYTCQQCHVDEERHPYVDTCTQVTINYDYGWFDNWYVRFGWYPLYYEPPYYYWDVVSWRPYWFWYYPINYSWCWYPVYYRPYPVWRWCDSPYYYGDYNVRYRNGQVRSQPLYGSRSPSVDRGIRDGRSVRGDQPVSVSRANLNDVRRVRESDLVRSDMPSRVRGNMDTLDARQARRDRATTRTGVRTDASPRDRTIVSQAPVRSSDRSTVDRGRSSSVERSADRGTERRWTRPVVRNVDRSASSPRTSNSARSTGRTIDRGTQRDDAPPQNVHRSTTPRRRDSADRGSTSGTASRRTIDRRSSADRTPSAQPAPRSSSRGSSGRSVNRGSSGSSGGGSSAGSVSRSSSRSSGRSSGTVSRGGSTTRSSSGRSVSGRSSSGGRSSSSSARSSGRGSSGGRSGGGGRSRGGGGRG